MLLTPLRLFINLIPSFFLRTSPMRLFCVSPSHRLAFLLSLTALTAKLPSIQPLAETLLADTIILGHFHHPHSSLYKLRIGARGFLLDSWTLRAGPIGCPETSIRNHHFSLCNNTEEHSSQLPTNSAQLPERPNTSKRCTFLLTKSVNIWLI